MRNIAILSIFILVFVFSLFSACDEKNNVSHMLEIGLLAALSQSGGGGLDSTTNNVEEENIQQNLLSKDLKNPAAYIVPQCYTRTEDESGDFHNPCYTCHTTSVSFNPIGDYDLQETYSFPGLAQKNHWTNLLKDRTSEVATISDADILSYVREDNYLDSDGNIILAQKMASVPVEWDYNADGKWGGYKPDCYFNFDSEGYDQDPSGNDTGWRAFGYYPFLGSFWPTNGSTDDVLIRLASPFRADSDGNYNREIYTINLAIVEALIKQTDVTIDTVDETLYGVDLDKDGFLTTASTIKFEWDPLNGKNMYYVGKAKDLLETGEVNLAVGLYPERTEFLHSVRYLDVDGTDKVIMASRMKELRYGIKLAWLSYSQLQLMVSQEIKEGALNPDRLRYILGNIENGVSAGNGWAYQGFIEDANGDLRPQTYEEDMFCVGCHSGIGATVDASFVFVRKFDSDTAFQKGWYHWSQKDIVGIPEPKDPNGNYEYGEYLKNNGAGDEFRGNEEIIAKFFDADGNLITTETDKIKTDISYLLLPTKSRALKLNKAYKVIVEEQSYIYGRDATVTPSTNIHEKLEELQSTGLSAIKY